MFDGDLSELAQQKLILLTAIDAWGEAPLEQLSTFLLEEELMHYFILRQYLHELSVTHLVEGKKVLSLTEEGKNTLSLFGEHLPEELRERIIRGVAHSPYGKNMRLNISWTPHPRGVMLHLGRMEQEEEIFSLNLLVADEDEALEVAGAIEKHLGETERILRDLLQPRPYENF